jgi:hypothetical protein
MRGSVENLADPDGNPSSFTNPATTDVPGVSCSFALAGRGGTALALGFSMLETCKRAFYRSTLALATLLALGGERPALAQTPLEPVALSYRAPQTCPSFEEFLAEIERSTSRLRLARKGEPARRFDVVIEASGTEGHLELDGGNGGERAAKGAGCRAVAELLAFAVALAADPEAHPPEAAGAVAAFPSLRAPPARPAPLPTSVPVPIATEARTIVPSPTSRARWQWSVAGAGFAAGTSSPAVTWGGGVYVEAGLNSAAWAPRLRLGGNYARKTVEVESPPGRVALTTAFLSLEACSGALRRGALTFLPCLRAQGGTRNAEGLEPLPGRSEALRGFLDLGVAAHLGWRFAGPVFIEWGVAVMFPTVRDQVKILPSTSVYDVPALGLLGELALGVEFGDQTPN